MSSTTLVRNLQQAIWAGSLPLAITLAPSDSRVYDKTDTFFIHVPRLSYLPFLLPKLHSFYQTVLIDPTTQSHIGWFSLEGVPLKWHHPIGLLYDLFSGANPAIAPNPFSTPSTQKALSASPLPWRLTVHFSAFPADQLVPLDADGKVLHDAFINSVKEADFLRNGTANAIMKLNLDETRKLWESVVQHDLQTWASIYNRLVPQGSGLRHIPLRIYLPTADTPSAPTSPNPNPVPASSPPPPRTTTKTGHLRVVQSLIQPYTPGTREQQTLGTALNSMIPALFPSRRRVVLARPVLHGAVLPLEAVLEDLIRGACYADGWLSLGVEMMIV